MIKTESCLHNPNLEGSFPDTRELYYHAGKDNELELITMFIRRFADLQTNKAFREVLDLLAQDLENKEHRSFMEEANK